MHVHCTCLGRRSLNVYGSQFMFRMKFVETKTVPAERAINTGLCHTVLKTVKRNSVFNNQVFRTRTKSRILRIYTELITMLLYGSTCICGHHCLVHLRFSFSRQLNGGRRTSQKKVTVAHSAICSVISILLFQLFFLVFCAFFVLTLQVFSSNSKPFFQ